MIGAGVFVVFAPAAASSGGAGLLVALVLAGAVAFANATSSAQLAAQYPQAGGTYVYGRERLGEWWGYLAGWSFVVGKTASCAAMAMTFAAYAVPGPWQKPVAVLGVVALGVLGSLGVSRTARVARVIVVLVLVVLVAVVVIGLVGAAGGAPADDMVGSADFSPLGVLQAAALLFFAFAGYARVATLGEEVRDPRRTIPRAVVISLGIAFVVYVALAATLLAVLGPQRLSASTAPLVDLVAMAGAPGFGPVVQAGAAVAALGALLALLAGVSRTTFAMARGGDLPRPLASVSARSVPQAAELTVTAVVVVLILVADLRSAIGFSSFGVLLYYFVANLAAFTQTGDDRRYPRALQVGGAIGCIVLAVAVPLPSLIAGAIVVAAGVLLRLLLRRGTGDGPGGVRPEGA
jgi:APA family basic amino acid/polyamine antiporter